MKPFQTMLPVILAANILFSACSSSKKNASTTPSANPAPAATSVTAADGNQQKLDANKKLVMNFFQALYGDKDSTAIDKYIAENIKQHNPLLQDGREWLKNALRPFLENPNVQKTNVLFYQIAAEGNLVWIYVKDVAPNGKVFARVDIFRVENGKITEAWKVSELVPEDAIIRAF